MEPVQSTSPAIRTAMRMSRHTLKVRVSSDSPPLLTHLTTFRVPATGTELQRKQTVRPNHIHHVSAVSGILGNSPYVACTKRRKPTLKAFHKCKKGPESCKLDDCEAKKSLSLHLSVPEVRLVTSTSILDLKKERKRPVPNHPKPIVVASCSHRQLLTHTGEHIPPVQNHLTEAPSLPLSQNPLFSIHPVVHLQRIDSEDLQESPRRVEEVLMRLKEKRSPKSMKLQRTGRLQQGQATGSLMAKYNEETAHVLGNTQTLARRRSGQMVVPERLFRYLASDV